MTRAWKTTATAIVFENKWMKLRNDNVISPGGKNTTYSFVERNDGIAIIAQDKDGSIYLIQEYHYPIQETVWQLPAGHAEKEYSVEGNAQKELLEETGIQAKEWKNLGYYFIHSGVENTRLHVYLARDLHYEKVATHGQEADEMIMHVEKIPIEKIKEMIQNNTIKCGWTLASLNLFLLHLEKEKGRSTN